MVPADDPADLPPLPAAAARARLVEALMATGAADREAFRRVYALTSAKLFGICLRICGDRQAAEDVLHDVYITIWQRAGAYQPGRASPISWLATIARNRAIDWRRAKGARPVAEVGEAEAIPSGEPSALERLLDEENEGKLHTCLEGLDDPQRGAIRTAFFDGLTYAELAVRQGVPIGTMKSWVRRGLIRLRKCLDDDA